MTGYSEVFAVTGRFALRVVMVAIYTAILIIALVCFNLFRRAWLHFTDREKRRESLSQSRGMSACRQRRNACWCDARSVALSLAKDANSSPEGTLSRGVESSLTKVVSVMGIFRQLIVRHGFPSGPPQHAQEAPPFSTGTHEGFSGEFFYGQVS